MWEILEQKLLKKILFLFYTSKLFISEKFQD